MSRRLTFSLIFLVTILMIGGLVLGWQPASATAASPNEDLAVLGSVYGQAATTAPPATTAAATPTPVPPTATPVPPTPATTPGTTTTTAGSGLPVVPIFLGILFVGLVLAVTLPILRSRFGRR